MRSISISARLGALLMIGALAGCVVAPDGGAYENRSSYGAIYLGGAFSGTTIHRYGKVYPAYAHRADTRRIADGRRDWRAGDDAFRRQQRALGRVGLEERQRLDRQERIRERRQDNADRSRDRRGRGRIVIPGSSDARIRERSDRNVGRRLERSSQAERRAQRRAAEVRRQLRAERQAGSE